MLRVLAVIYRAGHFLLLLIVHLGIDVAAAWKLPEKQRGIGVLSPKPRTVGFVVFVRWGCSFAHVKIQVTSWWTFVFRDTRRCCWCVVNVKKTACINELSHAVSQL